MMKKLVIVFAVCLVSFFGCSKKDLDVTKEVASDVFNKNGFELVAYEGYQYTIFPFSAKVWFIVKRSDDPTIYNCYLQKWGDEYHIYDIKALNAIRGGIK